MFGGNDTVPISVESGPAGTCSTQYQVPKLLGGNYTVPFLIQRSVETSRSECLISKLRLLFVGNDTVPIPLWRSEGTSCSKCRISELCLLFVGNDTVPISVWRSVETSCSKCRISGNDTVPIPLWKSEGTSCSRFRISELLGSGDTVPIQCIGAQERAVVSARSAVTTLCRFQCIGA